MLKRITTVIVVMIMACSSAFAFDFWNGAVSIETALYPDSSNQYLDFTTTGTEDNWYQVGCYPYARVNGVWESAYAADPGPGAGNIHLYADAMAIFFSYDATQLSFMIITGMPSTGFTAPSWYGEREFGPGDLKIDVNGETYGIGMRDGGLNWAGYPITAAYHYIREAGSSNTIAADQNVRDEGNKGQIKLNPTWYHTNNDKLGDFDVDRTYAFFDASTGTNVGTAIVNVFDTALTISDGADPISVYAYEVIIPRSALGMTSDEFDFMASWRSDCGNDIISMRFTEAPEPGSMIAILTGLIGLIGIRRRR